MSELNEMSGKKGRDQVKLRYPHVLQSGETDLTPAQLLASRTPADKDATDDPAGALAALDKYHSSSKASPDSDKDDGRKPDEESER